MYAPRTRSSAQAEFTLPEGRVVPNTLFVGGINMEVDENEIRDLFARFGSVKEVKIITYHRGVTRGYGFVYFDEHVNIQSIIKQNICFKGQTFKLGPAILKKKSARPRPSKLLGPAFVMSPTQYFYCSYCSHVREGLVPPSAALSTGSPSSQPYPYSSFEGIMFPQMLMNYAQNACSSQTYADFPQNVDAAVYSLPEPPPGTSYHSDRIIQMF